MAISSINIQSASSHCFAHNDRSDKVTYLVDESSKNEYDHSATEAKMLLKTMVKEAEQYRRQNGLRAMKSDVVKTVEAVVNLNAGHNLADVQKLAGSIEKEFGFRAVQIAIHRDEGKDKQNKNYHAHIVFCNLTPEGKTIQRTLGREGLAKLQDLTAKTLEMTRGKAGSKAVRLEHKEFKHAMRLTAESAKNPETDFYDFRAMQKKISALETENSELKKELHKLNTAANKTKELETIKALEAKIQELQISSEGITEQKIQKLELDSEITSIKSQARHEETRANFAEPPSAYEAFNELTKGKDSLDKKEIEKIKQELKAHDRKVKDFAKKIIEGVNRTKTALFSILDKITGKDIDNQIKLKIEGKESEIEAYTESEEVIQETTHGALKAFVEEQEAKIHAHTPSKLG